MSVDCSASTATTKSPLVVRIQRAVWATLKRIVSSANEYKASLTAGGVMSKYTESVAFSTDLDPSHMGAHSLLQPVVIISNAAHYVVYQY
ncbi:hypothetical protein EGR_11158 [Echinococcus granulosus]|uniref:Uncharacterized protein n=1 Tax=Echinococcus granulosus TaxID=6210 RepID=W6TYY6_ECHGR|nr:hypothetical protein EGR_11158 [Echinococcus granulosus]EUB53985.1 hypothetical protein EGR_11158 [Echinococcus granulosus]